MIIFKYQFLHIKINFKIMVNIIICTFKMHYKFGYLLNKRYIFLKYINYGAFSQIWLIYDILFNDYCIAKIIDSDNIETGRNEINILRKLKRLLISNNNLINNVLLFREIIESEKEIIIIENLQDLNLKDLIYDYKLETNEKEQIIKIINKQLDPVLIFLKNNSILHTDIKPENIFIKIQNNKQNKEFDDFIKDIKNLKCKPKDKIKEINRLSNIYYQHVYLSNSSSESDSDDYYDINTDSDISSDYDIEDDINEYLVQQIYKKKEKEEKKKKINFNINDCIFSIGDFGNAIDYSTTENIDKINCLKYHDLQTRYYRHPNIIMRSKDILDSDLFAFKLTIEEIKNQSVFIEPFKSYGNSTDREHLRLLINTNQCLECTKGRKTELFFNYEPLTKKYYLSK